MCQFDVKKYTQPLVRGITADSHLYFKKFPTSRLKRIGSIQRKFSKSIVSWLLTYFIEIGEYKWENQFTWKINVILAYKLGKFQNGH